MIITQTPLRISFLGGNTDFRDFYNKYGGCVLTTSVNKYIYCILKKRFDEKIYINYSIKEIVDEVDEIKHELVREAMKKVGVTGGIEISYLADIPASGSGLGSSSSVTVGTLNALYNFVGHKPTAQQLAEEAVEIELDILGHPIGVQDQYIAAYGGLRFIKFNKSGSISANLINLSEGIADDIDNSLMLFFTGKVRKSGTILKDLKQDLGKKTKTLLKNKELARKGKKAMINGNMIEVGELLHKYWELKKGLSQNISNSHIDEMYEKALEAGAIGGKISGAGGGGFLLLVVPDSKRQNVRKALSDFREMPFRLEKKGSRVIFDITR